MATEAAWRKPESVLVAITRTECGAFAVRVTERGSPVTVASTFPVCITVAECESLSIP